MSSRSIPAIQAELADVRHYLAEAPPHSAAGLRGDLLARVNALERELAAARTTQEPPDERHRRPLSEQEVGAYLTRLGHRWVDHAGTDTLHSLHRAHVTTVPFENLDIVDGVPLQLAVPALHDKVVARGRGGFCYELNGLFAALLASLGHEVDLVAARPEELGDGPGARFEHVRLLVTDDVGHRWLADVGNGASWPYPLPLRDGASQDLGHGTVRLVATEDGWRTETRPRGGAEWSVEWRFDERPRTLDDFATRCRWQERSPASHFTQGLICTRAIDGGRISLTEDRLRVTIGDEVDEQPVDDDAHLDELLLTHFGIRRPRGDAPPSASPGLG